jgi:hypothetical protein
MSCPVSALGPGTHSIISLRPGSHVHSSPSLSTQSQNLSHHKPQTWKSCSPSLSTQFWNPSHYKSQTWKQFPPSLSTQSQNPFCYKSQNQLRTAYNSSPANWKLCSPVLALSPRTHIIVVSEREVIYPVSALSSRTYTIISLSTGSHIHPVLILAAHSSIVSPSTYHSVLEPIPS